MTLRDQIEFKIRKLTRAIDALADLTTERFSVSIIIAELKADRTRLRRANADGRRSCGECGHPMTASRSPWVFRCETPDCSTGIVSVEIV